MAQAIVLQTEILGKDVLAISSLWVDALRSQERYQVSYLSKIHELIDSSKRQRQNQVNASTAGPRSTQQTAELVDRQTTGTAAAAAIVDQETTTGIKSQHKDINDGYVEYAVPHA